MGKHEDYGKRVVRKATGGVFKEWGKSLEIDYGYDKPARIDGTIKDIAVEIESRVDKQVRGAVLDLICHECTKKLLILLPVHMSNPEKTKIQCRNILKRFMDTKNFRVILLNGNGDFPFMDSDVEIVKIALKDLGFI